MKILALDIETSPLITYSWGIWNQNIGINQIQEPTRMLCFAARWVDQPKRSIEFYSEHESDHWAMVESAWQLVDEADALLTFNGKKFDGRHLNREFVLAGLGPPSPVKHIDLLQVVRKQFLFPSNKLEWVSQQLGLAGKVKHEGFGLWLKCLAGDEAAWKRMERYNKQDVHLLVDAYRTILPWISNHPNLNLYGGDGVSCPTCGGVLHKRGTRTTGITSYQRYRCSKCGAWSTDGKALQRSDVRADS